MMALEYRRNCRQGVIALTQRRDLGNRKMFPRNQSEGQRRDRAKDLAHEDDVLAAEPIRQMAGWQLKGNDGNGNGQTNKPERSRRMGKPINLPFHRHREHETASDREQIASRKQAEIPETERCIRIMRPRLTFDRQGNGWALALR